jgi:hypothetical protein
VLSAVITEWRWTLYWGFGVVNWVQSGACLYGQVDDGRLACRLVEWESCEIARSTGKLLFLDGKIIVCFSDFVPLFMPSVFFERFLCLLLVSGNRNTGKPFS